jgi:hypothetical protein
MPTINRGGHFLFTEAATFARLQKYIYGDGQVKTTALKNNLFLEVVVLCNCLHKSIYRGGYNIKLASKKMAQS